MLNDLKNHFGGSVNSVRRLFQRPAVPTPADTRAGTRETRLGAREEHHRRVRVMRRELYQLLEQHPSSRELMRHLDLVERTLRQEGFGAVNALPLRVIAKALQQLEKLVWDWTPEGLAELRSRLAMIVRTRQSDAADAPGSATQPSAKALDAEPRHSAPVGRLDGALVGDAPELDHAAFEEMERSWSGEMPAELRNAMAAARPS
jgi:hypothetical protein